LKYNEGIVQVRDNLNEKVLFADPVK